MLLTLKTLEDKILELEDNTTKMKTILTVLNSNIISRNTKANNIIITTNTKKK